MRRRLALFVLVCVTLPALAYEAIRIPTTHYHYDIGLAAIEENEFQRAIDNLRLVVRDEPRNADAHDWLGFAYQKVGQRELALEHLREAVRLDPKHLRAHLHLGETYVAAGDKARARDTLAALNRVCKPACEEARTLARAIETMR